MLGFLSDKQGEVRQAAAYGCGVLGQFSGLAFAQVCAQAIPRLVQVIQDPDSRNEVNLNPTENAIAAVTKILKYNASAVNVDEVCSQEFHIVFGFVHMLYLFYSCFHTVVCVLWLISLHLLHKHYIKSPCLSGYPRLVVMVACVGGHRRGSSRLRLLV